VEATASRNAQHCCFIIQAVRPYFYDLNQILALPTGFRYHNRYNQQWVDPNLRGNIAQLLGRRVLIIMRDRERNRLVPARWATISVAQSVGDVYYFEYRLGDLIEYAGDPQSRETNIAQYTETLQRFHAELPGTAGMDLTSPSVFQSAAGNQFPTVSADNLSHWGNVVGAVATATIYEKIDFLKIVDLSTADGSAAAPVLDEAFRVSPNTVYVLRVFQTIPNFGDGSVIPHDIRLLTFTDHIASLRARQRAVGKYDMLSYVLKVLDLPSNEHTSIEVAHDPEYEEGTYASGSIYIPLKVRPSSYLLPVLRIGVAAGALLFVFKPTLVPADEQLVRSAANVIFVLVVAGTARTLQALWPALPWR
jgi:hypothetical protein